MPGLEFTFVVGEITKPDIEAAGSCVDDCAPEAVAHMEASDALERHAISLALQGFATEVVAVDTTLRCQGGGHEEWSGVFHCMAEVDCAVRSLHRAARPEAGETPQTPPYQPPHTV